MPVLYVEASFKEGLWLVFPAMWTLGSVRGVSLSAPANPSCGEAAIKVTSMADYIPV